MSIAKAISNMSSVSDKKRVVVITQGADPIIVATGLCDYCLYFKIIIKFKAYLILR